MIEAARADLAKDGVLRVGINLSNILLVTGRQSDGTPVGVAADMGKAIADALGVPVHYQCYDQVGPTGDAISAGEVDIGLIAHEAERAKTIGFSSAYCEIEATYLVRGDSPISTIDDVDQPGITIAAASRAAYQLYLERTLRHAKLKGTVGLPQTVKLFLDENVDVLAGLRPALLQNAAEIEGARVLEGRYMAVQQSVGTAVANRAATAFLDDFVSTAKTSGMVAETIARHNMTGRLSVAP